jgi:hypothetical protein
LQFHNLQHWITLLLLLLRITLDYTNNGHKGAMYCTPLHTAALLALSVHPEILILILIAQYKQGVLGVLPGSPHAGSVSLVACSTLRARLCACTRALAARL